MTIKLDGCELLVIFGLLAVLLVLLIWRAFRVWTADRFNSFEVRDFIMENGKASSIKLWLNGAFGATTWAFVYLMLSNKGDGALIVSYGALWVTPLIARLAKDAIVDSKTAPPPQ